jgi:hypothetical protein
MTWPHYSQVADRYRWFFTCISLWTLDKCNTIILFAKKNTPDSKNSQDLLFVSWIPDSFMMGIYGGLFLDVPAWKFRVVFSSLNHPALQCENLHVTSLAWKELLMPWLKNRQMFPVGTNTTPAVIASSESGQPVILACLTRDKPSLLLSFGGTS